MKKIAIIFLTITLMIIGCNLLISSKKSDVEILLTANEIIDSDKVVNEVLDGINESDFEKITHELNQLFNDQKTLKERIIDFFNGDLKLDGSLILIT